MSVEAEGDFHATGAKKTIRREWDRKILQMAMREKGDTLTYFGLPGPDIEDLIDWRDLLGCITGVERLRPNGAEHLEDLERHRRLLVNVGVHDIPDFELLRGYIEDIIRDTFDLDGRSPQLNDGKPPQRMRFLYDLINLDYLGGVAYRAQGDSKQVRALKTLFERQQGTNFVLLMTLNVRDKVDREITQYLQETAGRFEGQMRDVINWYASRSRGDKAYKLKAIIPMFVKKTAEHNMFCCHAYPPVAYDGTGGERMVHFAFYLKHVPGNFQAFSPQTEQQLLDLPLLTATSDKLALVDIQHPSYEYGNAGAAMTFLSSAQQEAILSTRISLYDSRDSQESI